MVGTMGRGFRGVKARHDVDRVTGCEQASATRSRKRSKELGGPHDTHSAPRVEHQEIVVTGDDEVSTRRHREFKILVVFGVSAIVDRDRWLYPDSSAHDQAQNSISIIQQHVQELRTSKDALDFRGNGTGQRNDIRLPGPQHRASRNSIALEHRANDRAGINDDQPRRSAL
jgi:hypothetical protein